MSGFELVPSGNVVKDCPAVSPLERGGRRPGCVAVLEPEMGDPAETEKLPTYGAVERAGFCYYLYFVPPGLVQIRTWYA